MYDQFVLLQGLPVLTINGDAFPSRVGASLLSSFRQPISRSSDKATSPRRNYDPFQLIEKVLVTFSKKSFEDVAIRLLRSPKSLLRLRELLNKARSYKRSADTYDTPTPREKVGLFDTKQLVQDFVHAMEATGEVNRINSVYSVIPDKKGRLSSGRPHIIVGR